MVGRLLPRVFAAFGVLILTGSLQAAIIAGQIDNFQGGSAQGWTNGGGAPPVVNIETNGPAGAGDRFIRVTSDSSGLGPRLTTFNLLQWTGDYIAQGVTAIEMDLQNLGFSTLSVRLAFRSFNGSSSTPGYLSEAFPLAPGAWQRATFSISITDMTPINSPSAYDIFFTNVGECRIINELGATNLIGDIVTAQLGIDNIHAIPEPRSALLMAVGLTLGMLVRRRGRLAVSG